MNRLNAVDWIALVLVIIGAINWGLIGFFDFNLVTELFGVDSALTKTIYALVGIAGVVLAFRLPYYARYSHTKSTYVENE